MENSELSLFWKLAEGNDNERIHSSNKLLQSLTSKQGSLKEPCGALNYSLKRLIRGLSSARKFARLGFATALTKLLREIETIGNANVLKLITEELQFDNSASKSEKSNVALGQMLAYLSLIQAGRLPTFTKTDMKLLLEGIVSVQKQKVLLHNLCTEALVQIINQLDVTLFKKTVWPQLQDSLTCGWEACTPDTLRMLIHAHETHKDLVNKEYLARHWDEKKLLSGGNCQPIATVLMKSTADHPIFHPVCSEILKFAADRDKLSFFWEQVVMAHLFDTKKMNVDFMFLRLIPTAIGLASSANQIQAILSEKTVTYLMRQLSQKKCLLNKATKYMVEELQTIVTSQKDAQMSVTLITCFLSTSAGVNFDSASQTATVSGLIRSLNAEATEKLSRLLMDTIVGKTSIGSHAAHYADQCKFAGAQLCHMLVSPSLATKGTWQLGIVRFLCLHGNFLLKQPIKSVQHCDQVPEKLTPELRALLQNAFKQSLSKMSTYQSGEKGIKDRTAYLNVLREIVKFCQELFEKPSHVTETKPFSSETRDMWNKVMAVTRENTAKSDDSRLLTKDMAFELALLQMALELFTDANAAVDVLEDLFACRDKAFQKKKKSHNDAEPAWIEVLTDLLLSLLSRPSQLMRGVVNSMFAVVCPSLTPAAFQLIIETIEASGADEGPLDFEDDEDEEEDEGMIEDTEEHETNQDSESQRESDSSSDSESDEDLVNESVRENVKAALGKAAVASDVEESASDLSDSEMEKYDDMLSSAFRSMRRGKRDDKEKARQLKSYKMRCVDLLEILVHNENTQTRYLQDMLEPLLMLLEESQKDNTQRDLYERAHKLFRALCRAKPSNPCKVDEASQKIEEFVKLSTKVTGIPMVTDVGQAIVFLAKNILSQCSNNSASLNKDAEEEEQQERASKRRKTVTQTNEKGEGKDAKLHQIIREAMNDFCKIRDSLLSQVLFNTIFQNLPCLMWPLIDDLMKAVANPEIRVFRRTQVCVLISTAITKPSVSEIPAEQWKEIANKTVKSVCKVLDEVMKETPLRKKFVAEVLTILHRVVIASDIEVISKELAHSVFEKLGALQPDGKDNKDLKRICNQLKTVLIRVDPSLNSPSKKKRKNSFATTANENTGDAMETESAAEEASGDETQNAMEVDEDMSDNTDTKSPVTEANGDKSSKIKKAKKGKKLKKNKDNLTGNSDVTEIPSTGQNGDTSDKKHKKGKNVKKQKKKANVDS